MQPATASPLRALLPLFAVQFFCWSGMFLMWVGAYPVITLAILPYESFEDAVQKAKANLLVEGAGHSAALHSHDDAHIRYAGLELPISRLVVNQPSSLTAGGSLTNGFAPTTTLGCGSWGGNSISENLDYKHLMNVSRIGKVIEGKHVPTDEEIWA